MRTYISVNTNHLPGAYKKDENGDYVAQGNEPQQKPVRIENLPIYKARDEMMKAAQQKADEMHKLEVAEKKKALAEKPPQENPKFVAQHHKADIALKNAKVETEKARKTALLRKPPASKSK